MPTRRRGPQHEIPSDFFDKSVQVSLPFRFDVHGRVAVTTSRAEQVADNLATIALTLIRERVMRPAFGSRLKRRVFEANDELARATIERDLREAFGRWEPEAKIEEISFASGFELEHEIEEGKVILEVKFSLVDFETGPSPVYSAIIDTGGEVAEVRIA